MATALPRPLADVEMDELVRVEDEFQRRARTTRPITRTRSPGSTPPCASAMT